MCSCSSKIREDKPQLKRRYREEDAMWQAGGPLKLRQRGGSDMTRTPPASPLFPPGGAPKSPGSRLLLLVSKPVRRQLQSFLTTPPFSVHF